MNPLHAYRDDGPLAALLGRLPGSAVSAPLLAVLGVLPLVLAVAFERRVGPATIAAVAWFVVLGGASAARPLSGSLDWLVPIVLRTAEYGAIIALAWFSDRAALPAAYAALFAVSVHQYEIVYRIRHLGSSPPRWVGWAAGGWELRMIAALILAGVDLLEQVALWYAAAAGTLFVAESAAVWIRRASMRGEAMREGRA